MGFSTQENADVRHTELLQDNYSKSSGQLEWSNTSKVGDLTEGTDRSEKMSLRAPRKKRNKFKDCSL